MKIVIAGASGYIGGALIDERAQDFDRAQCAVELMILFWQKLTFFCRSRREMKVD